jgi:hypothetical protein
MRKIIVILLVVLVSTTVKAQFSRTKWKGTLELDQPMEVMFDFRKDTVEVFNLADNSSLEIMQYTIKDSTMTLQKISGASSCDASGVAKYRFRLKNDQFFLIKIDDDCDDRANVLNNTMWKRTQ